MWPILLSFGPIKVYSYAVAFLLAAILFFYVIWKCGREAHFDEDELMDVAMIVTFGAIVGARLSYIFLVDFRHFGFNLGYWVSWVSQPGWWYLGAFGVGGLTAWWQTQKKKWDLLSLTDVLLTAYSLFLVVMALGRFLNGSGYGIVSNTFLGMRFGGLMDKHLPVQLFEMVAYAVIFWFLLWSEAHYRTFSWYKGSRSEAQSGFITAVYFILSGMIDLIFSPMKLPTIVWGGIRMDIIVSFSLMAFGAILLYLRSGAKPNRKPKSQLLTPQSPLPRWGGDIFD